MQGLVRILVHVSVDLGWDVGFELILVVRGGVGGYFWFVTCGAV